MLKNRLKEYSQDEDNNEEVEEATKGHASVGPLFVMVDENYTGATPINVFTFI